MILTQHFSWNSPVCSVISREGQYLCHRIHPELLWYHCKLYNNELTCAFYYYPQGPRPTPNLENHPKAMRRVIESTFQNPRYTRKEDLPMNLPPSFLRDALMDWTDWDGAMEALGTALGILPKDGNHKAIYWTKNPVSDFLLQTLWSLIDLGVLEVREEPDFQFRWIPADNSLNQAASSKDAGSRMGEE